MNIKRLLAAALFDRPDKIGEALEINIPDRTDGIIEGIREARLRKQIAKKATAAKAKKP